MLFRSGKDVFTVYNYTKARLNPILPRLRYLKEGEEAYATSFKDKCNAFLTTLFPSPSPSLRASNPASSISGPSVPRPSPPYSLATHPGSKAARGEWDWPDLEDIEISRAIFGSSNKKAPGPDSISFLPI